MKLFSGLLAEGLEAGLKAFQSMTRDDQIKALEAGRRELKEKLDAINLKMEEIKTEKVKLVWQEIYNDISSTLERMEKEIVRDPIGSYITIFFGFYELIFRISEAIWGSFYEWLLEMFMPKGPVSFKDAVHYSVEFFTIAGDFNVLATIFDLIGHTEILGSKLPANAVSFFIRNISWTFGIGWLTWVVMGPVLRHSIADPYDKEVRKITRPADFTVSQIEDLYEHGVAKLEEFVERLVELGYADDKIMMLYELIKKRVLREEARRYVTDVAKAYVKGYVSESTLWDAISLAYWTDDEKAFRLMEENIRKAVEITDLRVKEIEKAFKDGKISEEEATARLSGYIVDPEMIEAYIALWKQYIKPEEEIEPNERLLTRKRRLEIRIKGLQDQITYLQEYLRERLELYDVMIREVENRYRARMERIEALYDARIAAIREEFAVVKEARVEELRSKLATIEAEISRFIELNLFAFKDYLSKISDETLMLAAIRREYIFDAYTRGNFDELHRYLTTLIPYVKPEEEEPLVAMLKIVDKYYDLAERYRMLLEIATLTIEERERRVEIMVNRLKEEKMKRIAELQGRMQDEIERIEKKKKIEETEVNMRIARLQTKVDELSVELTSIIKQLEAMKVGG